MLIAKMCGKVSETLDDPHCIGTICKLDFIKLTLNRAQLSAKAVDSRRVQQSVGPAVRTG